MRELEELARAFDGPLVSGLTAPRPSGSSLSRIQEHFGIVLPPELVWFAKHTHTFGHWFASLGADYDSPHHIIRINSYWRRRRPNRRIPRSFIVINLGFDDDLDCLDVSGHDPATGEFVIRYWTPGVDLSGAASWQTFREYLEFHISAWERDRRAALKRKRGPRP